MRLYIFSLVFSMFMLEGVYSRNIYRPSPLWNVTNPGDAGVKIRFTQKGLDHLKDSAWEVLGKEIAKIEGVRSLADFGKHGSIELKDIKVTEYNAPEITTLNLQPPNSLHIGWENISISVAGEFIGRLGALSIPGSLEGTAEGVSSAFAVELVREGDRLLAKMTNCSTELGNINFTPNPRGPLAGLVKQHLGIVNQAVTIYLPQVTCAFIDGVVERFSDEILTKFLSFSTGNASGEPNSFMERITKGLIMDNSIVDDPVITDDYMEISIRGEMRYNSSSTDTPFDPPQMPDFDGTDKMFYMMATPYVMNSLLYQAYKEDKLWLRVTEESFSSAFSNLLKTSCNVNKEDEKFLKGGKRKRSKFPFEKYCLGTLIPAMNDAFPNGTAEFLILPHEVPRFGYKNGKAELFANGRVLTYVMQDGVMNRQVTVTKVKSRSSIKSYIEDDKILANLSVDRLKLRLHRSSVKNINPKHVRGLGPLFKVIIGPTTSEAFSHGLSLPGREYLNFVDSKVIIEDGLAVVAADFEAVQKAVVDFAKSAIKGGILKLDP